MTAKNEDTKPADETTGPVDPREQMRLAMEAKKNRGGRNESHEAGGSKASPAHTNSTVHREFRRKSGG